MWKAKGINNFFKQKVKRIGKQNDQLLNGNWLKRQ